MKKHDLSWCAVTKEALENTAMVIGPQSAAQQALDRAKTMRNPQFLKCGPFIVVTEAESH